MMKARLNSGFTCSGVALVAMSKSLGVIPSSRSRTAPPTTNALYPACCSLRITSCAPRESCVRRTECAPGPYTRGSDEPLPGISRASSRRIMGTREGEEDIPVIALGFGVG